MQRIALVVVEKEISRWRNGASTDQTAYDAAAAQRQLIRIGEIELGAIAEARRAEGKLPAIDSSGLYLNRDEDTGVIQAVLVDNVGGASQKTIGLPDPPSKTNAHPQPTLFI